MTVNWATLQPVARLKYTSCFCFYFFLITLEYKHEGKKKVWTNVWRERVCFLKWTVRWYCAYRIWYCTCVDIVTDALHGDGRISNSSTLQVPHYAFDPTMHLHATSTISLQAFANPVPNFPHQHLLHNLSQWMLHDVMVWCIIHDDQFNSEIRFHICPFEPDSIFKYKLCPRVGQAPLKSTSVLRKQHNRPGRVSHFFSKCEWECGMFWLSLEEKSFASLCIVLFN